jgi:hypothetical protein
MNAHSMVEVFDKRIPYTVVKNSRPMCNWAGSYTFPKKVEGATSTGAHPSRDLPAVPPLSPEGGITLSLSKEAIHMIACSAHAYAPDSRDLAAIPPLGEECEREAFYENLGEDQAEHAHEEARLWLLLHFVTTFAVQVLLRLALANLVLHLLQLRLLLLGNCSGGVYTLLTVLIAGRLKLLHNDQGHALRGGARWQAKHVQGKTNAIGQSSHQDGAQTISQAVWRCMRASSYHVGISRTNKT